MPEQVRTFLLALEVLVLLLPLTVVTALVLLLMYPAYPPMPNLRLLTVVFDIAMLVKITGILVTWRLAVPYLLFGPGSFQKTHKAWFIPVLFAGIIGLVGVVILLGPLGNSDSPSATVGFALFAPAAALIPIGLHLLLEKRSRHSIIES